MMNNETIKELKEMVATLQAKLATLEKAVRQKNIYYGDTNAMDSLFFSPSFYDSSKVYLTIVNNKSNCHIILTKNDIDNLIEDLLEMVGENE